MQVGIGIYLGLGGNEDRQRDNIIDYYKPMGMETAEWIANSLLQTPEAIREAITQYEEAGVDEFMIDPALADPDQVDLLANVVFG